ncbi:MAG: TRAP transporter small permease [Burkholderiaceae bacterium]|nr:TRAP transporter small permease [Burkholderiaceae bacterium]
MRRSLDKLYDIAAVLAAMFLVALLGMVLLTIVSRELQWALTGIDGYAGYFMAACGFLSLAHTFKKNEHIRVTLFLGLARGRGRFWIEAWALGASAFLSALFAAFSVRLVMQSIEFNDVSTSMDATPLWIPQLSMAVGTVIFAIAVIDELVMHFRHPHRVHESGEALRHE